MVEAPFGTHSPNVVQNILLALIQNSKLKRGAFRPLMSRLMGAAPIDTVYQGARFRLHHRDSGTERGALFNPDYNLEELDFLRAHTPVGGVFVDVGANVGTFAVVMALHVGRQGRVLAIEPYPSAHQRLAFNTSQLAFENVTLVRSAVGDTEGELTMSTAADNLGASRVSDRGITVPVKKLTAVLGEAGIARIDALKIDIEGYEDKALIPFFKEAEPSLWPKAVAIEHLERADWTDDCIGDMQARGYDAVGKTRSNTFLVRRP